LHLVPDPSATTTLCTRWGIFNGLMCTSCCSLRSSESPDETLQRLDDLVKRQRQFGDLLLSADIKQVPICPGMSFGSIHLPKHTASDNQFISVNIVALYCPRLAAAVACSNKVATHSKQHFVNSGRLVQAVSHTQETHKNPRDLDF